jgi:hypothetical protein
LPCSFLALLRNEGLPAPKTNQRAGSRRVDCCWPDRKLTIELDSYRYHHTRYAWEQDRRYAYGDVLENPALMLAELRALLRSAQSAPSSPR